MVSDYFLEIDGIKGESFDSKHPETIEPSSFTWGLTQSGSAASGGGAGKAVFQDFHFVAKSSKASPLLFLACATGQHIKKAILFVRKAGKDQQEFYEVKMEDLLISSYQSGGASGEDPLPADQVSVNFAKIEFTYRPQKADGTLDAPVVAGYDVKLAKKI